MVGVSTLLVVLTAVLAGAKYWGLLRRDCARRWMREIAHVMDAVDSAGAAVPASAPFAGRDRALLGAAAGPIADFLGQAARPAGGEDERERLLRLGDAALRRLRDLATGRRRDLVTRA